MPTFIWILIGGVILAVLSGAGKERGGRSAGTRNRPYRIDHLHVAEATDYECSVCHERFREDVMSCPRCGVRFTDRTEDDEEYIIEEDELDSWDDEEEN